MAKERELPMVRDNKEEVIAGLEYSIKEILSRPSVGILSLSELMTIWTKSINNLKGN